MSQIAVSSLPSDLNHELTQGFAARFIRRKSRQMLGHTGLREADRPDIEQYLLMSLWRAIPKFDSSAGDWRAFVATVIERRADRFLKRRRAFRRMDGVEVASLDVLVKDQDGVDVPLATQIGKHHQEAVTGCQSASEAERVEMALDVTLMLESAPPRTRYLCEKLRSASDREVADQEGINRRTVRKHLRRLREKYGDEEFQKIPKKRVAQSSKKGEA